MAWESIVRGEEEEWDDVYSSVSEFIQQLNEEVALAQEEFSAGWIFWRENERQQQQQQQILTLLQNFASFFLGYRVDGYLVQYWAVVKVEGRHHHLSTSLHPFSVGHPLSKGLSWYRKLCRGYVYVVDMEAGADDEEIGGVGRAYRNKHHESSPDLRLYSTNQFPWRDYASRCGFRGYLALPLFHLHANHCYGVLELSSHRPIVGRDLLFNLDKALQIAGFNSIPRSVFQKQMQQPDNEINEIVELAMATVPRLYLALVWVPAFKQCAEINANLIRRMGIESFNNAENDKKYFVQEMYDFLEACELHNLQIDLSSLSSNLCDDITKNPLAHYAQRARMLHSFPISLQSLDNSNFRG